jgi:uncharacterized membrane protein
MDESDAEGPRQEILEKLGDESDPEVIQEIIQAGMFAGPLPPPSMLREYEDILPGTADRIMGMAENEQKIRSRDNKAVIRNDSYRVLGSVGVSVGLVVGAVFCAWIEQPEVAVALAASGAIPQIIRYFNRKSDKTSEEPDQ